MANFGFGMVAFFRSLLQESPSGESSRLHLGAIRVGTALLVLATLATVAAAASHWFALRKLRRGESPALGQLPLSVAVALLFAVIGLGALWAALR
jgi:uncharacterized membrane protein YidH (DUF202 family)